MLSSNGKRKCDAEKPHKYCYSCLTLNIFAKFSSYIIRIVFTNFKSIIPCCFSNTGSFWNVLKN
ncbi:MAG TPA: hypothetical protein DDY61_07520 [Ruminococcaceae bacterium]|nr:hypothetical protein [Oscillospiraceae bacterium]